MGVAVSFVFFQPYYRPLGRWRRAQGSSPPLNPPSPQDLSSVLSSIHSARASSSDKDDEAQSALSARIAHLERAITAITLHASIGIPLPLWSIGDDAQDGTIVLTPFARPGLRVQDQGEVSGYHAVGLMVSWTSYRF